MIKVNIYTKRRNISSSDPFLVQYLTQETPYLYDNKR